MGSLAKKYDDYFEKHQKKIIDDFFTFLRFPSISADPAHKEDIRQCATWVMSFLKNVGLEVELWSTSVNPVVFGVHKASSLDRPTILLYHHYDVQPVDPLELWKTPPFEPTVIQGEVYARGASDNKGQCLYSLYALKAFLEIGQKEDLNIKVLIDGEEETGSLGLFEVLDKKSALLKADYTLIVDLGLYSLKQPVITLGCRGIVTFNVECIGSNVDLHSGQMGGIAYNPLRGLAELLAKVWDKDGKIVIEHFYDDILPIDQKQLLKVDLEPIIDKFELRGLHHEKGYSSVESSWIRPTFEINGLSGGYAGPGFKTVIPARAYCKISCRLVPGQNPDKIATHVVAFLKKNIAKGLELKIELGHGGEAYIGSPEGFFAGSLKKAYEEVLQQKTGCILAGGTLPIASQLAKVSQGDTLGMGYAFDDDYVHAPNEHFGLDRLKYGLMTVGSLLELLAGKK